MKMNQYVWKPLAMALVFFFFLGCGNKNQQSQIEEEVDSFLEMAFAEPDIYFDEAIDKFSSNDVEGAVQNLDEAILFMQKLKLEEDTAKYSILLFAVTDLEVLRNDLQEGKVKDEKILNEAFGDADASIAAYHLAIVSDHIKNNGEEEGDRERLQRALIRLDHAADYKGYQLTEDEKTEIERIRVSLGSSKEPANLWNRINTLFSKIKEKFSKKEE